MNKSLFCRVGDVQCKQFHFFCSDFRNQDKDHRIFFQKIWKPRKKKYIYMLESFLHQRKRQHMFFVLIISFRHFGAKKKIKLFGGRCYGKNVNKSEEKKFELHKSLVRRIHKQLPIVDEIRLIRSISSLLWMIQWLMLQENVNFGLVQL